MQTHSPKPTEIRLRKSARTLAVSFDTGERFELPFEYLRVFSPSAEVRGHGNPMLIVGKENVNVVAIDPVGHYAVRLKFDDGHDTGLYSWTTLYELGAEQRENWSDYVRRLKEAGYQHQD
jgi:DUF971 family protein